MEVWQDIKDYEGYYQVSNVGGVRALERIVAYKGTGPRKRSSKILKMYPDPGGYLNVRLCKGGKTKNLRVHRLVAQAFIDNPNDYPVVNHLNATTNDNRVENLAWCTIQQNNHHTISMGNALHIYGSNNHLSKINETKAKAIKHLLKTDMKLVDIAYATETSYGIVKSIKSGVAWKHI